MQNKTLSQNLRFAIWLERGERKHTKKGPWVCGFYGKQIDQSVPNRGEANLIFPIFLERHAKICQKNILKSVIFVFFYKICLIKFEQI